jgi:hypothetical protein
MDLHGRITSFEEGDCSYMVEVGVEDKKFRDPCLIDTKAVELAEEIGHQVTHTAVDDHGCAVPLEDI